MTFLASPQQQAVIDAPATQQCVIACPGSGKTATAVRRLVELRKRMGRDRGYALLLSYSNTAVKSFQTEYLAISRATPGLSDRVRIETVDSFLTSHVLRPHAARVMKSPRQPFLVSGSEPFLTNFTVYDGKYPRQIRYLAITLRDASFEFCVREKSMVQRIDYGTALKAIYKLGATGAYTHELGRFWALMVLMDEARLHKALSTRYPHVIVDEAQDVGTLHSAFLDALGEEGSTISLIGDPDQAIYEFAGADGRYLQDYVLRPEVSTFPLSENRRSLECVVNAANTLAGRSSQPVRAPLCSSYGAYYVKYETNDVLGGASIFESLLRAKEIEISDAAILCRGRPYVALLNGAAEVCGQGATRSFCQAAIYRDRTSDIARAFRAAVDGTLRLLKNPHLNLGHELLGASVTSEAKELRRLIWVFMKDKDNGLPSTDLKAVSEWLPNLKVNVQRLFGEIEKKTTMKRSEVWRNNLTKRDLVDVSLCQDDLVTGSRNRIRVDTVHQAKGEGIRAVMYLAKSDDLKALLGGTSTEHGRIGYVAVTRARDLIVLGIPSSTQPSVVKEVERRGFERWVS